MKERPILFSAPMVRTILAGEKTQTRRIIKPQPYIDPQGNFCWDGGNFGQTSDGRPQLKTIASPIPSSRTKRVYCPHGAIGHRLWVRETWQYADWTDCGEPHIGFAADSKSILVEDYPAEWAQRLEQIWTDLSAPANFDIDNRAADRRWRPSIHMPRWACRCLLDIGSVRVERLQDISAEDAIAEGLSCITKDGKIYKYGIPDRDGMPGSDDDGWPWHEWERDPVAAFAKLWSKTYGASSWDANPWVWVIDFRRATT